MCVCVCVCVFCVCVHCACVEHQRAGTSSSMTYRSVRASGQNKARLVVSKSSTLQPSIEREGRRGSS